MAVEAQAALTEQLRGEKERTEGAGLSAEALRQQLTAAQKEAEARERALADAAAALEAKQGEVGELRRAGTAGEEGRGVLAGKAAALEAHLAAVKVSDGRHSRGGQVVCFCVFERGGGRVTTRQAGMEVGRCAGRQAGREWSKVEPAGRAREGFLWGLGDGPDGNSSSACFVLWRLCLLCLANDSRLVATSAVCGVSRQRATCPPAPCACAPLCPTTTCLAGRFTWPSLARLLGCAYAPPPPRAGHAPAPGAALPWPLPQTRLARPSPPLQTCLPAPQEELAGKAASLAELATRLQLAEQEAADRAKEAEEAVAALRAGQVRGGGRGVAADHQQGQGLRVERGAAQHRQRQLQARRRQVLATIAALAGRRVVVALP